MKRLWIIALLVAVVGCSAEDNEKQYQRGWSQARADGCQCDPFLSEPHVEKQVKQSSAWANGYTQACIAMKKDPACRVGKPDVRAAQELKRDLSVDP
ncbi:MAG: hypothetical protein CMN28_09455 [Salinisphaeraceae bacterium]|nr:hypothetical protein [Salinisphaeraceae bacterium]